MLMSNLSVCLYIYIYSSPPRNYPAILQHLFSLSCLEKSSNARLMDNICGAICHMVEGNQDAVPLDQVRGQNAKDAMNFIQE